ncbi:magnesium transporter [Thermococcus sp.]|uniref:magnesium transporter n=1 Tax=Thermococcus sp. TaxID=35749 RepID=UPI000F12647C|nr:magnesium transporter [Thermococcus sp.]RLF76372.1 MAG: magnesium transporter MgtE [Thermococci archaeon]MCD6144207.1 magnesium transporter [Thermococcus sp.]RLF80228.1 MAG: magnesium transporter MgtE [Thermococci archaeon]RLF83968.1 MAG: magnesium transporter MgtE [Thermococci archaeon]RLF85017.1 MAG: magnesium transporter MgtE [Thermococci archaeon]
MVVVRVGSSKGVEELLKEIILASFPALFLCLFLDFFAGAFLGKFFKKIMIEYPIILVILPGLMGLRGNIYGSLASRFTTMLHLGEMNPTLKDKNVVKNIFISILLSLLPVTILWLVGVIKVREVGIAVAVFLIVITSTIFTSLLLGYSTALATIIPFKKGVDPDAVAAPIVTSIADLITIPLLVGFMFLYEDTPKTFYFLLVLAIILSLIVGKGFKIGEQERKVFVEVLSIVGVLAFISSISGTLLESYSDIIHASIIFSVMYPAILDSTGNLGSVIGAKTSTRIHLGEIEKLFNKTTVIEISLYTILAAILGVLANLIAIGVVKLTLHTHIGFVKPFLLLYPLLAFGVMWMAYFLAITFDRLGLDPDNATVPTITTLADIFSTLFTVGVAHLIV